MRVVPAAVFLVVTAACRSTPPTAGNVPGLGDVPLPRGVLMAEPPVRNEATFTATYVLPDDVTPAVVVEFYRREMPGRQWRVAADTGSTLRFEKPGRAALVTVSDTKRPTVLLIRVTESSSGAGAAP